MHAYVLCLLFVVIGIRDENCGRQKSEMVFKNRCMVFSRQQSTVKIRQNTYLSLHFTVKMKRYSKLLHKQNCIQYSTRVISALNIDIEIRNFFFVFFFVLRTKEEKG